MDQDGFLYPTPKETGIIVALVVEKKGDETRTSMRQSEIYVYSPRIRVRDGFMTMPKYYWNEFEPGDWLWCKPVYSEVQNSNRRVETELTDIKKINPSEYSKYEIPQTDFVNGNVQIQCPFVLCPSFIRNRETRNAYGTYKKMFLLGIGQGYIHNSKHFFRSLIADHVYSGVFEFRAKDNGAVNFAIKRELCDETNHTLERDSMWELVDLRTNVPTDKTKMDAALRQLLTEAKEFNSLLLGRGFGGSNSKSNKNKSLNDPSTSTKASDCDEGKMIPPQVTETSRQERRPEVFPSTSRNMGGHVESLSPRDLVIVRTTTRDVYGNIEHKWKDLETDELSTDNDILIYKYNYRHGIPNDAPRNQSEPPVQRVQPAHEISLLNATTIDAHPLASSTPRTSPEPRRRSNFGARQDDSPRPVSSLDQTTETMEAIRQDNNANPIHSRATINSFRR